VSKCKPSQIEADTACFVKVEASTIICCRIYYSELVFIDICSIAIAVMSNSPASFIILCELRNEDNRTSEKARLSKACATK